jgi:anti-repressor protein
MEELIKIKENAPFPVDGRELHAFMQSKQEFSAWIKARIVKYSFIDGVDFTIDKVIIGKNIRFEYSLTIDMAKELSMVEGNEKGKVARRFFIQCEKVLKEVVKPMSQLELMQFSLNHLIEQSKKIEVIEEKVKQIEAKQITSPIDFYSVAGFGSLQGYKVDITLAANLGRKASSLCNELGFVTGSVPDPRFGKVKTYPTEVLQKVFDEWSKKI